ncbi:MAG TPA: TonB family protein [Vicinamibacterales bacterium]|nr:TonB family protein [Vicinamibacterales bacterium]
MPRELFVDSLTSRSARPRSRWTLIGSLVAHLLVLIAIVVMPLTAALDNPAIAPRFAEFIHPTLPPTPPPVRPVRPQELPPPVNPDAAPPEPGTTIATEKAVPPAGNPDGVPVPGLPVTVGRAPDGIGARSVTTLVAPPARVQPVPVGGQIREPRRIAYVPPTYPVVAQTARVEGIVILEAIIDETGAVRDVRVLRSIPLLDRAAIDAVSRWRYLPTQLNGVAVPVIMTVTVSFTLR